MSLPAVWLSCGVLRLEMQELLRLGKISGELLLSLIHISEPTRPY